MLKTKRIITLGFLAMTALLGCARGAKVTFQPIYSDVRFLPTDQLHAGCSNSADILFSPQGQKITKFTIILYYDPENIEILRVLPIITDGTATSTIEYNRIIFEVKNPTFSSSTEMKSFFQLYFKSATAGKQTIYLGTGSEAVTANKTYPLADTFTLDFAQVPECEPDIVPPSINLIYPKDTSQKINLDQYFIFDIKDIGKGVDKTSVIINFDGEKYFYGSDNLKWNGNYLTFYPGKRIPINVHRDLKILVADQQSYGGANTTQSTYSFITATGMMLTKPITPMMFRNIALQAEKISASPDECALLADSYTKSGLKQQKELKSIIQKVGCNLTEIDSATTNDQEKTDSEMTVPQKRYKTVSVFATLGWVLFLIAVSLKFHYLFSYKRHKKLVQKLQNQK